MIILLGKSGSGKDTVQKKLLELGVPKVAPYTTRPMREGETEGADYHFLTEGAFLTMQQEGKFACMNSYIVASGKTWHYGIAKEGLSQGVSVQSNPLQLKELLHAFPGHALTVYLYAPDTLLLKRRMGRGAESEAEIRRRLSSDARDFAGLEHSVSLMLPAWLPPETLAGHIKEAYGACMPHT